MDSLILLLIVIGIASAYFLSIMILEAKESHEGPILIRNRFVSIKGEIQRASIFDLIRRCLFAFHVMKQENNTYLWVLKNTPFGEVWTCPRCLSFWTTIPFTTFFFTITNIDPLNLFSVITVHLALSFTSLFLYRLIE